VYFRVIFRVTATNRIKDFKFTANKLFAVACGKTELKAAWRQSIVEQGEPHVK
jgi:hypothetical protein